MFTLAPPRTVSRIDPTRTVAQIIFDGSTTPKKSKKELQNKFEAIRRFKDKDKQRQELRKKEDLQSEDDDEHVKKAPQSNDKYGNGGIVNNKFQHGKIGNIVDNGIYNDGHRKWALDEQLLLVGSDGENNIDSEDEEEGIKVTNKKRIEDSEDEDEEMKVVNKKRNKDSEDEDENRNEDSEDEDEKRNVAIKKRNEDSEDEDEGKKFVNKNRNEDSEDEIEGKKFVNKKRNEDSEDEDEEDETGNEESEEEHIHDNKYNRRNIYGKESNYSEPEEADEDEWDQFLNKKPNAASVGVYGFPEHKIVNKANKNKKIIRPQKVNSKMEPEYEDRYDDDYGDDYEDESFVNKKPNIYETVNHQIPFNYKKNKQVTKPDEKEWDYKYSADKRANIAIPEIHQMSNTKHNDKDKAKQKQKPSNNLKNFSNDRHLQTKSSAQSIEKHKPYYPLQVAPEYDDKDDDWDESVFGKKEASSAPPKNFMNIPNGGYFHNKTDNRSLKEKDLRTPIKAKSVLKQYIKGNDINQAKTDKVSELERERIRRDHVTYKIKMAEQRKSKADEVRQRKADMEREDKRRREGTLGEDDAEEENKKRILERFRREKEMQEKLRKQEEIYNVEKALKAEDDKRLRKKKESEENAKKLDEERKRKISEQKQHLKEVIIKKEEQQKAQKQDRNAKAIVTKKLNSNRPQQVSRLNSQPSLNPHPSQKLNLPPTHQVNQQPGSYAQPIQQRSPRSGPSPSPKGQLNPESSLLSNPSQPLNANLNLSPRPRSQLNPQPSSYPNPSRQLNSNSSLKMKLSSIPSYNLQNSRSLDNLVQKNAVAAQVRY